MRTFRWTVPQPEHSNDLTMTQSEFDYWDRTRNRGVEFYVASKGLVFLIAIPLYQSFISGDALSAEVMAASWLLGLTLGTATWLRREHLFQLSLDDGMASTSGDIEAQD